ncbi:MAG: DUF1592 domain-containing protein [Bryobacteraceae bacterium]
MEPRASQCAPALAALAVFAGVAGSAPTDQAVTGQFEKSVRPLLQRSCYGCHNSKVKSGDLDLVAFKTVDSLGGDLEAWEKVATKLADGTMPPKGVPRPPQAEVEATSNWIRGEIKRIELTSKPDPGRVTARRLNRAEYNNTIRDLTGLDLRPAEDFPQDDSGYGFDNIGDVLSLSPVLLEKYMKAAETVVKTALSGAGEVKPMAIRAQPPGREFELFPQARSDYDTSGLSMPNALHAMMRFPAEGEYVFKAALEGRRPTGSEPVYVGIWVDGKQVSTLTIDAKTDGASIDLFGAQAETRLRLPAGEHWIAATVLRIYEGLPSDYGGPNPTRRPVPPPRDPMRRVKIPEGATPEEIEKIRKEAIRRAQLFRVPANRVWVHWVEALGPYDSKIEPPIESRKRILTCGHVDGKHVTSCDRTVLSQFARRAFRRTVTAAELRPYLELAASARRDGAGYEEALGVALQAILVSPDFLFRIEKTGVGSAKGPQPVNSFALASRLSYFLWSTMPDDELLRVAEQGGLRKAPVLQAQVKRMLRDPKALSMVENFAGQWLELRRLESVSPDREKFEFDEYLRMSMRKETELFFANLMREDRSILELLNGRYSFLNQKMAEFYGVKGVTGPEFRRVEFDATVPRSGVLTQASVMTVSSYATRTSPVLRGKWILENLLNEPIPPPPPNVPLLEEATIGAAASLRKQMEQHRTNPACASCHAKMDPIGFGFENFNAIGQWRDKDGKFEIDPSGTLPDGRNFKGPEDLKALLMGDKDRFTEAMTDKMLTYALGRGLERYDRRTIREIAGRVAANEYRFSSLVMEIVKSLPFQMTREDHASEEGKTKI